MSETTTPIFPPRAIYLWDPKMIDSLFVVPRLNMFHQNDNRIKRHQLLQVFLSFLLQLLFHIDPMGYQVENLEKELRYLLTILGDISWMLVGNDELEAEFQNLLSEFEPVANQAGRFVHTLLSSTHQRFKKMDKGAAAILKRIDLLKADVTSFITTPADANPRTSIVNSFLFVDSLVDHLEDLLKHEDDRITDVRCQLDLLHQGLILFNSSINDMRSPQPSELGELKEPLMRIGDVAHQAEYLISAFLVEDAPLWYVIKRLIELNHKVEVIRSELHQFGGLKVVKYLSAERSLQDKRPIEADEVIVGFEDKETDILDQLVGGGTWSLKVISIFGMPGLGMRIAAKCRGLPLMAVVISGILSTVDEEEESRWEEVEGSLASYIDGEDNLVMKTLELSYKHLPDYLKPCFLYFGAFEEDRDLCRKLDEIVGCRRIHTFRKI